MIYPFNEPIKLIYKTKSRFLSFLNKFPLKDYFLKFFWVRKFPKLTRTFFKEEIRIRSRIVEHPLVFENLSPSPQKILDVGCCESRLAIELASLGYDTYGIDWDEYPLSHPNLHFVKGDITKMPFKDNFFDYVMAISTIEHIGFGFYDDPIEKGKDRKAINEMKRVLKNNGKILISLPYGEKPWPENSSWCNKCHWYNAGTLKELVKGLKVEKEEYFIKRDENWFPASKTETYNANPSMCIVFLRLSKKNK